MTKRKWWNGTPMMAVYIITTVSVLMGFLGGNAWAGFGFGIAAALYWMPALIARGRYVPNTAQVAVVNLFGFLLGIPWMIALVMAFTDRRPEPRYVRY